MARKPQKFRKYLRGSIDHSLQLGTLAGNTVISSSIADTVTEKAWVSSVRATWSLADLTPASGDGPILVGVAHNDYIDAEIEAWIENTGSWEEADMVQQEIAKRKIRRVGLFETPAVALDAVVLNDGKNMRTKCGWMLTTGQTVRIWAYNTGASALATTDPVLRMNGFANLWPR